MVNDHEHKEVRFDLYCKSCKHEKEPVTWDGICDRCLSEPTNLNSEKPVNWEAK